MPLFFVGERPSQKALDMGVAWEDGRLAAKQLFDALRAAGIDPAACRFTNAARTGAGPLRVKPWLGRTLRRARRRGDTVVAMGAWVASLLRRLGVAHLRIVHPAARGRIRKKAAYAAHVKGVLCANQGTKSQGETGRHIRGLRHARPAEPTPERIVCDLSEATKGGKNAARPAAGHAHGAGRTAADPTRLPT